MCQPTHWSWHQGSWLMPGNKSGADYFPAGAVRDPQRLWELQYGCSPHSCCCTSRLVQPSESSMRIWMNGMSSRCQLEDIWGRIIFCSHSQRQQQQRKMKLEIREQAEQSNFCSALCGHYNLSDHSTSQSTWAQSVYPKDMAFGGVPCIPAGMGWAPFWPIPIRPSGRAPGGSWLIPPTDSQQHQSIHVPLWELREANTTSVKARKKMAVTLPNFSHGSISITLHFLDQIWNLLQLHEVIPPASEQVLALSPLLLQFHPFNFSKNI